MRPLRLEIEGLTSFRERQVVPFEDFDLFVITGPTGAGKTTILDAMTLALYGSVPRTTGNRGSLSDLVSHGIAEARVLLEFEAEGEKYRVARRLPRKTAQSARVERLEGDEWVDDCEGSGVKAANARIIELVKLDFASFTKAVLLPQGEFHTFLKGDPSERRQTLVTLLGLEHYVKVGELARGRAARLKTGVERTHEILEDQFGDATKDALATAKADAKEAVAVAKTLKGAVAEATASFDEMETAGEVVESLETRAGELASLAGLIRDERERCSDVEAAERDALAAFASAEAAATKSRNDLSQAKSARAELVKKYATRERLAELQGLARSRSEAKTREKDAKDSLDSVAKELKERKSQTTKLEQVFETVKKEKAACEKVLDGVRKTDKEEMESAERLRHKCEAAEKSDSVLGDARQALAKAVKADESAVNKEERAQLKQDRLRDRLEELRASHSAAELAHGLGPGDACPVCERPLEKRPHSHTKELKDLQTATDEHERAAEDALTASRVRAAAATTRSGAESALAEAEDEGKTLLDGYETLDALRAACELTESKANEAAVSLTDAEAAAQAAVAGLSQARDELTSATKDVERLEEQASIHTEAMEKATSELEDAESQLRKHFGKRLPADAIAALGDQRTKVGEAEEMVEDSQARLDEAQEARRSAEEARDQAVESVREVDLLLERLKGDSKAARNQLVATIDQGALKVSVKEFSAQADGRSSFLTALAGGVAELNAAAVKAADKAILARDGWAEKLIALTTKQEIETRDPASATKALVKKAEEASEARVRTAAAVETIKTQIEKRTQLEKTIADDTASAALLDELGRELRADRFVQFIIDEMLDLLAEHASGELLQISDGRYSLACSSGEFEVIDHANADERRSVRTLSGGETFLASLSLALALSKQVSELAGEGLGASLEAVFIDEGFGTLDPDTLEDVIDALERLREQELAVGVISHVPELAERIQIGLAVRKDGNRSQIELMGTASTAA